MFYAVTADGLGDLTKEAAEELGLPEGTPVAQGGGDAFVGALGLGMTEPGKMALITGSSHVIVGQAAEAHYGRGFFGSYTDGIIPGQYSVEGGQVSTGSIVAWFKNQFAADAVAQAKERGVGRDYSCAVNMHSNAVSVPYSKFSCGSLGPSTGERT